MFVRPPENLLDQLRSVGNPPNEVLHFNWYLKGEQSLPLFVSSSSVGWQTKKRIQDYGATGFSEPS